MLGLQRVVYAVLLRQLVELFLHEVGVLQFFPVALQLRFVLIQLGVQLQQRAHVVLPDHITAADGCRGDPHPVGADEPLPLPGADHVLPCGAGAQDDLSVGVCDAGRQRRRLEQLRIPRVGRDHPAADAAFVEGGVQQAEHHVHIPEPPPDSRQARQIEQPVQQRDAAQYKRRQSLSRAARNAALAKQPHQ